MLLRKLEAYGFKSFADKLEVEFGQGITAIVGPNGSGKSNITDAIRWVLGEQNVRNLRGSKTEDIIFAGSSGRRALGVAEVSLTFDNETGLLPLDYKEVIITRRLFRSGDSEYYINKTPCRLKDIHNLLADTGLGRDAMTVISQNKIDEVLNSKPEERRLIFEEVAGVTRYKNRKKEALRKLDDTAQNLLRVSDIIAEIEAQLSPLAESAEKTKKYNEITAELTDCQITLLSNKLQKYNQLIESATLQKNALADNHVNLETTISLREVEKEKVTNEVARMEEELQALSGQINDIVTTIEKNNGQASVLEERLRQANLTENRLNTETSRIIQQLDEAQVRITHAQESIQEKRQTSAELTQQLTLLEEQNQALSIQAKDIEGSIENIRSQSIDSFQELVGLQNQAKQIERALAQNQEQQTRLTERLTDSEVQLAESQYCYHELGEELASLRVDSTNFETEQKSLSMVKQQLGSQLEKAEQQYNALLQKQTDRKSRLQVLTGMQAEYDGFGRAIKAVLTSAAAWSNGVCGAVAEVINVSDRYVVAIETALGGALQNIITDHDDIAKQAIQFLKRQNVGRATFLPLNTIRPAQAREQEVRAAAAAGSLGLAASLVSVEPKYKKVIDFLLGRTIVADTIESAQRIARDYGYSVKIVTLDGELFTIGGAMTGGSKGRREASFLSRSSEIEAITMQIEQINHEIQHYQDSIQEIKNEQTQIDKQILRVTQCSQQLEIRSAELTAHREKYRQDIERINQAIHSIRSESERYHADSAQQESTLQSVLGRIVQLENHDIITKQNMNQHQQRLAALATERTRITAALTDIKIKYEALQQSVSLVEQAQQQHQAAKTELTNQLEVLRLEKEHITQQIVQANEELAKLKQVITELTAAKQEAEQVRDNGYKAKLEQLTTLQNYDKDLKDLRRKYHDIQSRLHEAELLYTKYSYEASNCIEIMQKQYAVTPEQAVTSRRSESEQQLTVMIQRLEQELAGLGLVNPNAIDEYERLCERHQFLHQQVTDLIEAKEYLSAIIKDIDASISKQFIEAFKKINTYFAEIFARLFGGGQARLQLGDPNNLLDSGIEIIVQPPGKKLQNLVLLSGGERALTVIALLFAFLSYRPAPFSVVDEIDAPLDEANLERFSNFLRDYSQKTQFIVVTHRKGTMEAADVLHGVTLEEAGVSRIVSVKLADKVS